MRTIRVALVRDVMNPRVVGIDPNATLAEAVRILTELHIGGRDGAVIVVTDQPHNGCGKFIARFGKDALAFVNGPEGRPRRLRGLCARVLRPGPVRPGDEVRVVRPPTAAPE